MKLALCCRPYVYFICNYAVGNHLLLGLFQSWALGYGLECYSYFQSICWTDSFFPFICLQIEANLKALENFFKWVWEFELHKRLSKVRGSDDRLHKQKLSKGVIKTCHCLVSGVSRYHVSQWATTTPVLASNSVFLERSYSRAVHKL